MTRAPAKQKLFATEAELCAAFLAAVSARDDRRFHRVTPLTDAWTPYAETAGWDILLVRKADGFQIGIEAKLRLNAHVVSQALEEYGCWAADRAGPDCRAVLVPDCDAGGFGRVADYIGLTIIRMREPYPQGVYGPAFTPYLPDEQHGSWNKDWHEWCPTERHALPDYIPDVAAGSSAPIQLTEWKIAAIKIAITLEQRGHVTRADFKAHGIDHRRWLTKEGGWLVVENGRYVIGRALPNFKEQHPRVYGEIAADADKWMAAATPLLV